ncbi:hypothetical protein [Actinoallomurus sp. NPDC050550]|uniref:hypothetical protein n=1 Tax=Actinoallomurus sp. NPDC050550 TaxID=3154937 RepID=UPI0033DF2BA4
MPGGHDDALPAFHTPADQRDVAADPDAGEGVLRHLTDSPYPFVWQALAANPRTPADVLARLCAKTDSAWNDGRLLSLLAGHRNADRPVLLLVLAEVAARLETSASRPYAAALALADRPELRPDEVRHLGDQPGASARLRRGLRRRLALRIPPGRH